MIETNRRLFFFVSLMRQNSVGVDLLKVIHLFAKYLEVETT